MIDLIKGKYKIVREIARSNDIVYEAQDTLLGRRIALKILNFPPNLTGQPRRERIERFNREARAAGRLSHPNIVSVYDFGEENGNHYIAMEYLDGQTLRDIIQARGAFPIKEAIDIACQILSALNYAHLNKVIHRDVKPDNIFIVQGGQVKLTDFGIARLTEESSLTSDGQVFGTPSYMSPEQIEGRGIDYRSDLFSLGVVLYEMLLGRKPFAGDSVVSITYAVMHAEPPGMMGVPTGIEQVIRRALSKNPALRQASAEQMQQDLRNAEQTPAMFLPSAGRNQGQTGMGGLYGYGMTGGTAQGASYGAYPSSQYPVAAPPVQPQSSNGLPWTWNGSAGNAMTPASGTSLPPVGTGGFLPATGMQPAANGVGGASGAMNGSSPYQVPPFPARPSAPLLVLSPGMKRFLLALGAAILIGGGTGFGVIAVINRYADYQTSAKEQQIIDRMGKAEAAYNSTDYATAALLFEQALKENPNSNDRAKILTELGYTYVCLARIARSKNDLAGAKTDYEKAVSYSPGYAAAHTEMSVLLESMGDHAGAQEQQVFNRGDASSTDLPEKLDSNTVALPGTRGAGSANTDNGGNSENPDQFLQNRSAEARVLIREGDALDVQGDHTGAEAKWQQAMEKGYGMPESDEARNRLEQSHSKTGGQN